MMPRKIHPVDDGWRKRGPVDSNMDPLFIALIVVLALPTAYFLFARPSKVPPREGRPDSDEPKELTDPEPHRHREIR